MEGEIAPFDDTLVRRRPSYTMEDFLSSGNGPNEDNGHGVEGDITEDHDSKVITNHEGLFNDLNKTPMLKKFANPFQSSPGKEESPDKQNSPLSTADKFKKLQTMNSRMVIPNINEGGLQVDVFVAAKDQQREHDIADVSMESGPSLNLNVVMIDNTRSSHGVQIAETQQDNPIDLDILLERNVRPRSVIGDELDFNNYSIHDYSKMKEEEDEIIPASSDDEEDHHRTIINSINEDISAAVTQNITKGSSSQKVILNSQSQSLISPSQPFSAVFSKSSDSIDIEENAKGLVIGADDTFTIPKETEGITSTQNEDKNIKRHYEEDDDDDEEDGEDIIKIKRRNACNILDDDSMNGGSSPIKRRILKSKNEESSMIEETYKIPDTDESNSGYATQLIPVTQSNEVVDSSPQQREVDQTDFEVPNTSAVSIGVPIDMEKGDNNDILVDESEGSNIVRTPLDTQLGILDILDDSTVFVNLENTEAMRITNVFKREDGYYLDVISHDGAIPITVHSKKLFAPVCLNIGDSVRYFKDRRVYYTITGLQKDSGSFLETTDGFSVVYIKKKGSEEEIKVDLSDIYLTMPCKTKYKFKLFRNPNDFEKYMDSQFVKFDSSAVIKPILQGDGPGSEFYPFAKCVFVLTGMSVSPTKAGTRSNNGTANNTPSNRVHTVDKFDIDCTALIEFIESKGGKVLQDNQGFESIVELGNGESMRRGVKGKKFNSGSLKISKNWKGFEFACVLSTRHSRTMKYLQGVSMQWPAVHVDFIRDCMSSNGGDDIIDNWRDRILDYMLPSGDMDSGYVIGMNLRSWMKCWELRCPLEDMIGLNGLLKGVRVLISESEITGNVEVTQLVWLLLSLGSEEVVVVSTATIDGVEQITKNGKWIVYRERVEIQPRVNVQSVDWATLVRCIVSHRLHLS